MSYELMSLSHKLGESKTSNDPAQLEACLDECNRLLTYYGALKRQKRRADEAGSPFSRQALERLKTLKDTPA